MNKLILIGNGFDSAHNLKTSYYHFISTYISEAFDSALKNGKFEDSFLQIDSTYTKSLDLVLKQFSIQELISFLFNKKEAILRGREDFKCEVKSEFFRDLLGLATTQNWVDIELFYYEALIQILEAGTSQKKKNLIIKLHQSFETIKNRLEKYLQYNSYSPPHEDYIKILFTERFTDQRDYAKHTLLLNFNYTAGAVTYLDHFKRKYADTERGYEIINIHGELQSTSNPIVFGFGDEFDKNYPKLEDETVKGFFDFIKSFWYFKTSNYHDLIRFIDSDEYHAEILGHSCGLSDRTMLKMIFEHENCKHIKIHYHETGKGDNYTELTQEISRHFTNKEKMRRKILPHDKSSPMPQVNPDR